LIGEIYVTLTRLIRFDSKTCFPVLEPKLKKRVIQEELRPYLKDNQQAWEMDVGAEYRHKASRRSKPYSAQQYLLELHG
jgi:polyphosphate kinase